MAFASEFSIENYTIGKNHAPFIVAEIGLNHNNDLEIGKKTIQAAKKAGVNAVKFQSYITEEFIDPKNSEAKFLFDIFKQYELSEKMHYEFQRVAKEEGLVFFSTPLCNSSVDLLVQMKVPVLKIASGDIVNQSLLKKCLDTHLPIFLSTGAADFSEVTRAVEYLQNSLQSLCLMHCVSMYPTPFEKLNLKVIELYNEMYSFPIGFSDHSEGFLASCLAVGYDACVIEKHFTLDKTLPGPDHQISNSPEELKLLTENIKKSFQMKGKKEKSPQPEEKNGRFYGRRSMYNYGGKYLPLRPALHTKDKNVLDSWSEEILSDIANSKFPEGPCTIKF